MIWDFGERLNFSEGVGIGGEILAHLLDSIPGSTDIVRSKTSDDKNGTDYWILRKHNLPPISVDLKNRSFDPVERWGADDACIETTSVYTGLNQRPYLDEFRRTPGWTINATKRTDLVVYTWPRCDGSRRFWILYFPHLCRAALTNWRGWADTYGEKATFNQGYLTLNVYPPRTEIVKAMRELVVGTVQD